MAAITRQIRSETERVRRFSYAFSSIIFGLFLAAHGAAHTLAFFVQWRLSRPQGIVYTTTLLGGRLDVGDVGIRLDGILWLVAALGFVITGLRLAWRRRLEPLPLTTVTIFSLVLCVLGLPQAWVGVVIDVAILVVLAVVLGVRSWEALDRDVA